MLGRATWLWSALLLASIVLWSGCTHDRAGSNSLFFSSSQSSPSHGWPTYRYDSSRTGDQPFASKLSDPKAVKNLGVKWVFTANDSGYFGASPIVVNGTVFIGNSSGHFYAIDENSGTLKWQYPIPPDPPLVSPALPGSRECKLACYGIGSSATYWDRDNEGAVVFGAQDPTLEPKLGSARLYALNARTGALIWKSDPVAIINGTDTHSLKELHERIKYSSPLVFNGHAYIGVADAYFDRPLQNGRVVAVDLQTGHIDPQFSYVSTGSHRGGAVWNSPAAGAEGVFFTTGNTRHDVLGDQIPEPSPNHGLSMIRVDKNTGSVIWGFQPVPYALDGDPDWAAGAAVMPASCGELVASVQKDGWAYAVDAGTNVPHPPSVKWQFPPTGYPFTGYAHGDSDYKHPGAAWNDVFIVTTGGEDLTVDGVSAGYGKLQALNACETNEANRVRWIADIPDANLSNDAGPGYAIGSPTVTGGIVYVGTNMGHLIVLADPSIWPSAGARCSNIRYSEAAECLKNNYVFVPVPTVLADIKLPDGGDIAGIRDEAALADGKVFVATNMGHVYMLAP
jgi:outer membrane protein assembly factor BamB